MVTLIEVPKLGHTAVQVSSSKAHPSSGAAQDHTRTWKLLTATLGYNIEMLCLYNDYNGCRVNIHCQVCTNQIARTGESAGYIRP